MATKAKRSASAPRHPEKKWGPFHGGVGVAVWLNEVQTDAGPKFFAVGKNTCGRRHRLIGDLSSGCSSARKGMKRQFFMSATISTWRF